MGIKKKKAVIILILILMSVIAVKCFVIDDINTTAKLINPVDPSENYVIGSGESVTESFYAAADFNCFYVLSDMKWTGKVRISLKNTDTGEVYVKEYSDPQIGTDTFITWKYWIKFPFMDNDERALYLKKGTYEVTITNLSEDEKRICLDEGHIRSINDYDADGFNLELSVSTETNIGYYVVYAIITIVILYLCIVAYFLQKKKLSMERFFLVSFVFLAMAYIILYTPWNICDATQHYYAAFRFSNLFTGVSDDNVWVGRSGDVHFLNYIWSDGASGFINPHMSDYRLVAEGLFSSGQTDGSLYPLPSSQDAMRFFSFVNYIPFILGNVIGKSIGLGTVITTYLGRVLAAAIYGSLLYRAISKTPIAKGVLALVVLLPNSVLFLCTCSYGGMVIVSSISFISCILRLSENKDRSTIIETCVWAFILGATKGGGYLLLLPLVFIIVEKPVFRKKNLPGLMVIVSSLVSALLFDVLMQGEGNDKFFIDAGDERYSGAFALQHPLSYCLMLFRTVLKTDNVFKYIRQIFGGLLGWDLESTLPTTIIVFFMFTVAAVAYLEKDRCRIDKKQSVIMLAVILLVMAFTPITLLSSTPLGEKVITGIQGRYFVPIVPLIYIVIEKFYKKKDSYPISLRNEDLSAQWEKRGLICFGVLSAITLFNVSHIYLAR